MPDTLRPKAVATSLDVDVHTVYRNLDAFPPGVIVRLGRTIRFNREAFEAWRASGGTLSSGARR